MEKYIQQNQTNGPSTGIAGASTYVSSDNIMLIKQKIINFHEVESENEYYLPCSKTEEGKRAVGRAFYIEVGMKKRITLNNKNIT